MRPAEIIIDTAAFCHNYQLAKQISNAKAFAVLKANAYGHGAIACAHALHKEADAFAVACIEEAIQLREAGITTPIFLLEGFFDASELLLIEQYSLWFAVHSQWQIEELVKFSFKKPCKVGLKLDSGMHRLGFNPTEYHAAYLQLKTIAAIEEIILMTHFARADELDCPSTQEQFLLFKSLNKNIDTSMSLNNSAALLGWPEIKSDWVRPGLMLYGTNPFSQANEFAQQLQPVMTLQSKIIGVRELQPGEPIGYNAQFITEQPTRVGVVAMGYADGYPQSASNGTPIAIDGNISRVIGRVSMDMLTVDLTHLPQANIGSVVECWGHTISVNEVAQFSHSSAYKLFCDVKRAKRIIR